MPFNYTIYKDLRLVLSIIEGRVTSDELKAQQKRMRADPDFDDAFDRLNDLTLATNLDVSGDDVKLLAISDVSSSTSRRAIVTGNPLHFGKSRQFELYHAERSMVHVFRNRHEALRWLGIPEDSGLY
jgi:hypothetical protein